MAANPVPNPGQLFSMDLTTGNEGPILKCGGRLTNETSEAFRSQVKNLLPGNKNIHLDLSDLHYVDSSGLGALLSTYVSARSAGCNLKIVNLSPPVRDLLKTTHLASVFDSYGDV